MDLKNYGKELIIDLHNCNIQRFTRKSLKKYFKEVCELIKMQRAKLVFWDDVGVPEDERQTLPHTTGTSAVQFILTSSITIHALSKMKRVYVNIFSCKGFDSVLARKFTINWFEGKLVHWKNVRRV